MTLHRENEIIITGFGGQGVVLTGSILGKAATIYDHKYATMTQSYGPEARGGFCSSQVVISDEEILFPYAEQPQILICLSQAGYEKNIAGLVSGGLLVWDTDLVEPKDPDPSWLVFHIPATRFAEELGNKMMANIVMLGFLSTISQVVTHGALKESVLSSVPPKTREKNALAFDRGRAYGEAILKSRSKQGLNQEEA